jgi:hypothetical protein
MNRRFPAKCSPARLAGLLLCALLAASTLCAQLSSPTNPLERKLQQVIVPKVDFKEASLDAVLDYLTQLPVKTKQGGPINIVKAYKSTHPDIADRKVTLTLSNVPWTEVLRYVCLSADVQARYESHAIIISAPQPHPAPSPGS